MSEEQLDVTLSFRLPQDQYDSIMAEVEKKGTTLSQEVRERIQVYLFKHRPPPRGDWRISPQEGLMGQSYRLNDPSGQFAAEVWPERNYEVVLDIRPHTQYEWHLITQRVITLVEAARVQEKIQGRPSPNAVCYVCGFQGDEHTPYGWTCQREGCGARMFMPGTFPVKVGA